MGTDVCFTDPEDERCFLAGTFGCHSCVEDGCGWFAGECIATCDTIADATCYSTETFTGIPVDGICQEAFVDEEDHRLCSDHDSCSTCTSTLKSDGKTPCQWYTDEESGMNWCGTGGCDFLGRCGADTCNEPSPRSKTLAQSVQKLVEKPKSTSCQALASCSDCMASSGGCAWVAGSCQDSCDEIADAACYTLSAFPSMVADDICFMAKEEVYNQQHCGGAGNCLDCTNTVMADGESKCSWFTDEQNNGWCGTPGCDMNGICGSSDSSICADPLIKNGNAKGESHKKHSILGLFLP
ncbi:expressed unknown protein [Seminavis robusta]|uniref:Uncharacterized protein n=1 Tax=Seminavis robusta TaxID=568900 RepID=A0A9N8E4E6_9STRA|nr:expressed unknown protein [Seminavis robusta]|eukprot:Sro646_g180800.1 n/a (296) ;mRNA; r:39593-40480